MTKKTNTSIQMIADYEGDISKLFEMDIEGEIPILVTRNIVLFPGIIAPIIVGREQSVNLVNRLKRKPEQNFAIFCQKSSEIEEPEQNDIYEFGTYARLVRILDMPGIGGNNVTIIVQGLGRCHLEGITQTHPFLLGLTSAAPEETSDRRDKTFRTAYDDLINTTIEYIHQNEDIPDESQFALNNIQNQVLVVNFICTNMPFSIKDKMRMMRVPSMMERVMEVLKTLHKEIQLLKLRQDIRSKTREDIDEQQREYFLQQQIKNIKEELGNGEGSPERLELIEKAKKKKWPDEIGKVFSKEIDKLDLLHQQSPEYSVQLNYLQMMVDLPWNEYTTDNLDLKRAERILNRDHYGMEKVKERILEYMAVLKLRGASPQPPPKGGGAPKKKALPPPIGGGQVGASILCLYGPPGGGKTDFLAIDPAWYRTEEKTPVYAWNDTSAPRVALLDENTTLPILKTEGNWLVVSLRGAAGWIWRQDSAAEKTERQDGERFAATILLEGMAETVWYEHAVNDAMGIALDFDYESLERHSEPDCEYFISRYDDAENPLNYLELRYYAADAETVAAAIGEELSKTYDITREAAILEGAGSCICVDASAEKGRNTMPYLLQTVYIVPTAGGCIAATAHCTIESAEGFGARFHAIMNTLTVTNSPA